MENLARFGILVLSSLRYLVVVITIWIQNPSDNRKENRQRVDSKLNEFDWCFSLELQFGKTIFCYITSSPSKKHIFNIIAIEFSLCISHVILTICYRFVLFFLFYIWAWFSISFGFVLTNRKRRKISIHSLFLQLNTYSLIFSINSAQMDHQIRVNI